jgi:hypothetical protein
VCEEIYFVQLSERVVIFLAHLDINTYDVCVFCHEPEAVNILHVLFA